jgi:hypothetical protein
MSTLITARIALAVLVLPLSGCGPDGSRSFNAPSPLRAAGGTLTIDGPAQIAPSSTGAFTAWLRRPGQADEDVTSRAQWRSTHPQVATVQAGVVAAHAIGETVIEALLDGQQIGRVVRAVPDGTFALNGTVRPNGPVFRARVEVSGGVGPPASTETSDLGTFRVLGVGGRVRVSVRMDGFRPHTAEVDVSADTQHEAVLTLDDSARGWRLSVTPATTCTPDPSLGQQTYSADVFAVLREPTALLSPAGHPELTFSGQLKSNVLTMLLADSADIWDYYPPGPRLRSASGGVVEVLGTAHATWNGTQYAGLVEGYVGAVPFVGQGYCYAANHQVTLEEK